MEQTAIDHQRYVQQSLSQRNYFPQVLTGEFTRSTLLHYVNLDRAQSTIALQIRTGNIALYGNPIFRYQKGVTSMKCPMCQDHIHTAEHLFIHCKSLERERVYLRDEVGPTFTFQELMTTHIEASASWAIQYFGIDQFHWLKKKSDYRFPRVKKRVWKELPLSVDWLWSDDAYFS